MTKVRRWPRADLVIIWPTKFELILRTAKTIDLTNVNVRYWHLADIGLCVAYVCF